jgi:hypothetical protein
MKHLLPTAILILLFACKKETVNNVPHLTFAPEEKKWFTFGIGDEWKFKNDSGDSLTYRVTYIEQFNFRPEYKDTSSVIVATAESYYAKIESATDSLMFFFYKESFDPQKLRLTLRWHNMKGYFAELAAIKNNASFNQKTINGLTYTNVTPAMPMSDQELSFTRFNKAWYDQGAGVIEMIDLNGVSWKRVN